MIVEQSQRCNAMGSLEETLLGNHKSFQVRFLELRRAMLDDGIAAGVPFHTNDLSYLSHRVEKEGFSFIQVTLPLLGRALEQGLISGSLSTPTNFARRKETVLPRLCYSVFASIFGDDGLLLSKPNVLCIRYLRQFLQFDGKLHSEPTADQEKQAILGFETRMSDLRKVRIPIDNPVLRLAQAFLGRVLSKCDLSEIEPGHGPGSVAEHYTREERWIFSQWPRKAMRVYPFYRYACTGSLGSQFATWPFEIVAKTTTRICLVPKDFRGPRLISAEPTVNQYLQQGQMKKLMHFIKRSRILSRSLKLEDQTFNQDGARRAFSEGFATLDLSDASDTVGVPLFWYLFSKVPKLRRQLMSTRSDFAAWKGREIRISAFAPMGSAVCFPIETLVFWSLAIASVAHVRRQRDLLVLSEQVRVFGDDIIIPNGAELHTLCETLRSVGCKPNMSKTCFLTPFRESCGTEWYGDLPVTIIRNRSFPYAEKIKLVHFNVLLDLQRKFFVRGLRRTAQVFLDWAREIWPVFVYQYTQEDPMGFRAFEFIREDDFRESQNSLDPERRNYDYFNRKFLQPGVDRYDCAYGEVDHIDDRLHVRFNRSLQRLEYRAPMAFTSRLDWAVTGYPRLTARVAGDNVERLATRDIRVKVAWRYLPAYRGVSSIRLA